MRIKNLWLLLFSVLAWTLVLHAGEAISPSWAPDSRGEPPDNLPDNLRVPDGHVVLLRAAAEGVQIYVCRTVNRRFEWVFRAPEATLFDDDGEVIGKHYAGPTWEALDGSKVVGMVREMDPGPDPDAIPWLLLAAVSHEGDGTFSEVTYIQRVHTVGGRAPTEGCDPSHVDTEARVDYTADYYFYVAEYGAKK